MKVYIHSNSKNNHMSFESLVDNSNCRHCGDKINPPNVFCNQSCAATYNNARRGRRKLEYFCKECGCSLMNTRNKCYCSNQCQANHTWSKIKAQIIASGKFPEIDYNYVRKLAKRFFRETTGWRCSICGLKEWCGLEAPLILDHTNGNPYDNRVCNLRLVCGNCNMQLPTFAGRNRGNGRTLGKHQIDQA